MLKEIRPALVFIITLTLITGLLYPLAMTGIAEIVFPKKAQGSVVTLDGRIVGSTLIGQSFTSEIYFHGRPSATTGPDPNDPSKTYEALTIQYLSGDGEAVTDSCYRDAGGRELDDLDTVPAPDPENG